MKNNKFYLLRNFVDKFIYNKSFEYFNKLTIKKKYDNLSDCYSSLILLVFIGNIEVGNNLIEKIIDYKKIENFNISFCFTSKKIYDHFINKINENFLYFSVYFSNEYGTDIQPTVLMYNSISKKYNFENIIKLHTKTIKDDYENLTNFLLTKKLSVLKKLLNKNICNCLNINTYYQKLNDDMFVKRILKKYQSYINLEKKFVRGTIFFTDHITFIKVIEFIKKNNFLSFIVNNLYENNSINIEYSPTHYLERLFGIIN